MNRPVARHFALGVHLRRAAGGMGLLLAGALPLGAEISFEAWFQSRVPEVDKVVSEKSGTASLLHAAALWRRDPQAFPALSDGFGISMLFQQGKFAFGPELAFEHLLTAVDSSRLTNGDTVADRSFTARLMTFRVGGQALAHLKGDRTTSVYAGIRAGVLVNPVGIGDWQGGHFSFNTTQFKVVDRMAVTEMVASPYAAITAGLRFFLLDKPIRPHAGGFRVGVEYLVATESAAATEMTYNGKAWVADTSGHKWKIRWDGLSLQAGFFFILGDKVVE